MPPKKKQGKSSKADKKRLKKEEEERRLREEEEARLIAEQEEQERLEREQREEEERLRLELKDRGRRQDELNGLHLRLMEDQEKVNMWESEARKKAEWVRYMICDGSPNPAVQAEINSFITLWKEDPNMDLQTVLRQCALALRLTDELEVVLRDETDPEIVQTHQDTLEDLQRLIHAKHLGAAEEILKTARACADIETGNMQMMVRDDDVTLCLWANIGKNPRFKGYDFQEAGLSFELPKQLTLSDISIRILYTSYDHLSHLSLRSQAQKKHAAREKEEKEKEEVGVAEDETLEDGEMKGGKEQRENGQQEQEDVQSLKSEEGNKSRVSVRSAKEGRKSSSLKLQEEEEEHLENIVEEEGITSKDAEDTPESEPTAAEPEPVQAEVHVVDLYRYTPLGGVYYFDLFQLPPQSITNNNWEMTKILDTGLQHFPYPSEQPGKTEDSTMQSNLPVGVSVVLPETVIFMQEPQVARWDPDGRNWRTDGVTETSYDSETPSISFKMESFYTFTLLQETHANMPFQSWELRPQGQDTVTLTITAALTEVTFSVQGNECMLQMDEVPGLNHIVGKRMSLGALQAAMTRAGVNVFVSQGSEDYVPVAAKDPLIEHAVYQQMALVSTAFAFSRSRWNSQCGQEHFVLRVCEQLEAEPVPQEAEPVPQEAWSLYFLGAQRSQRLKLTETSDEFSSELAGNTEFHSTFLHMLRDFSSPEGRDRVDHAHYLLVNTVQRLLCATRVLTFS